MNKLTMILAALGLSVSAVAASAQAEIDTDGDGLYSLEEMQAAYPDMVEETFNTVDANADGLVSPEEFAAGQEGGMIPADG